jgi:hypothetical protein
MGRCKHLPGLLGDGSVCSSTTPRSLRYATRDSGERVAARMKPSEPWLCEAIATPFPQIPSTPILIDWGSLLASRKVATQATSEPTPSKCPQRRPHHRDGPLMARVLVPAEALTSVFGQSWLYQLAHRNHLSLATKDDWTVRHHRSADQRTLLGRTACQRGLPRSGSA